MKKKDKPETTRIGEGAEEYIKSLMDKPQQRQWGEWAYNPDNYTLTYAGKGYEVALDEITTSAEMLDWIFQLHGKSWVTPKVMHDFLTALDDLLGPQANYCGEGKSKKASPKKYLDARKGPDSS
jgi:hypothetical protein